MTRAPGARVAPLALAAAFGAVYLFWGGTFLAVRYAVEDVPPLLTIAIRCAGGALILALWLRLKGDLGRVTAAQWRTAFIAGALLFIVGHGILATVEQRVASGEAALLMTTIPLWMVVLTSLRERRPPSMRVVGALLLGAAGVAVLGGGGGWSGHSTDYLLLILGAFGWAAGSLAARHGARPASVTLSTALQLAAGAIWVGAASLTTGELGGWDPAGVSLRAAAALAFLVVFGTVLGFGAYTWLMQVTTPASASSYAFVNPLLALGLAWLSGDGTISLLTIMAAALVVSAVLLIRERPPPPVARARDQPTPIAAVRLPPGTV